MDYPLVCDICGKGYLLEKDLIYHRTTQHRSPEFKCKHCSNGFKFQKRLIDHVRSRHSQYFQESDYVPENLLCDICGKASTSERNFSKHRRRVHNKSEYYVCDVCGKVLVYFKDTVAYHKRIHTGENKQFICEVCGKTFAALGTLETHLFNHRAPRGLCEICSQQFANQTLLAKHISLVHGALNHFKCELCDKAFDVEMKLTVHKLVHHNRLRSIGRTSNGDAAAEVQE